MHETAKTIAIVVLGFLLVVVALHPPEIPKRIEHPVELSPAYIAVKDELARTKDALAAARKELEANKAAAVEAAADRVREASWAAAVEAEARGALRTASKLYDDFARTYPQAKQARLAASRSKKLLADADARKATTTAETPAAPKTTP